MSLISKIKDKIQGKSPKGAKRSSRWPKVRAEHLQKNNTCAVCGGNKKIEVHHIAPFHLRPDLELESSNLITLCEDWSYGVNCHLLIGHTGNYRKVNPDVIKDAISWKEKLSK